MRMFSPIASVAIFSGKNINLPANIKGQYASSKVVVRLSNTILEKIKLLPSLGDSHRKRKSLNITL